MSPNVAKRSQLVEQIMEWDDEERMIKDSVKFKLQSFESSEWLRF